MQVLSKATIALYSRALHTSPWYIPNFSSRLSNEYVQVITPALHLLPHNARALRELVYALSSLVRARGCCCCFSHSAHWLPTRKNLLYTVANPARGLLNREKKKKKKSLAAPPPARARCSFGEKKKKKKKITRRIHMSRRYASRRYAGGLGPSRIRTRIPTTRQQGQWVSLRKTLRFRVRLQLSQSRCLSLLLAMSGRVFLFLPPRGHEPPPTLRDRLNPNLSLYRHRFPIPCYAKRPDVALYTVGPFFLLPTPSSTHCALKVSEHDSLWQPPAAH